MLKKIKAQVFLFSFVALITGCQHISKSSEAPSTLNGDGVTITNSSGATVTHPMPSAFNLVPRGIDYSTPPEVVAFDSCANQDAPQPLWTVIGKHSPDLFIFDGDTVYASAPEQRPVAEQYKKLSKIPEYRAFREAVPFMAMWDDHDSGQNDSGADNPEKDLYKKEFLKHFPYIKDSISWNQGGLYHVKYIGGNTTTAASRRRKQRILKKQPLLQVIMLDTRYFRSPLKLADDPKNPLHRYDPWDEKDKTKTILGAEQWAWLEEQLQKPADLRMIVSGIQVIAKDHGFEKWGNFPGERQRLFDLIKKYGDHKTVIISGDRHIGTIAKVDLPGYGPIFDITASSINRSKDFEETDTNYVGKVISSDNFGLALIDWKKRRIKLELRDAQDQVGNSVEFKF